MSSAMFARCPDPECSYHTEPFQVLDPDSRRFTEQVMRDCRETAAELEAALADESRREWARIALASVCVIVTFCAWSAIRPPSSLTPPAVVACIVWWSVHRLARWCVA